MSSIVIRVKVGHFPHLLFKSLFVKKERNRCNDTPNLQNTWASVICIVVQSFHDLYLFYSLYTSSLIKLRNIKC